MTPPLRGFIAAALMATAWAALAQASAPARPAPGTASATPIAPLSASGPSSAFGTYRRFNDQKVQPWRESNDLVGRIGGWQSYAREAAGADAAVSSPAPAASSPGSAKHHHHHHAPHGGHQKPKTP
jgi:hypothetical protein